MQWYNEPPVWRAQGDLIDVTTGPKTDFWRKTHYGFIRDNGHFYYQQVNGDFTAGIKVAGAYGTLYDQAGLMVRLDEAVWLKCGIEFVDGVQHISAVVTRDFSDWSVAPLPQNPPAIRLRLIRTGPAIEILYSLDDRQYTLLRLTYLTEAQTMQVGPMCAAPDGNGFKVQFEGFQVSSH